jgi:astacin
MTSLFLFFCAVALFTAATAKPIDPIETFLTALDLEKANKLQFENQEALTNEQRMCETEGDLFEGDILGLTAESVGERVDDENRQLRDKYKGIGLSRTSFYWPNAEVPYTIHPSYTESDREVIAGAMKEMEEKTCIKFVPRTDQSNYLSIIKAAFCGSGVGMAGQKQNLYLQDYCILHGTIIHELSHALGLFHEQSRPDRDNYIKIHFDNVKKGKEHNFKKRAISRTSYFETPYDYGSVMHYPSYAFAIDYSKPTITKLKDGPAMGQRKGLSPLDADILNRMYRCQ